MELRVCEYATRVRGFVVVSGEVRERVVEEECDSEGCCARVLLEPVGEPVVAIYSVSATPGGVHTVITLYRYDKREGWVQIKVHEEAVKLG